MRWNAEIWGYFAVFTDEYEWRKWDPNNACRCQKTGLLQAFLLFNRRWRDGFSGISVWLGAIGEPFAGNFVTILP